MRLGFCDGANDGSLSPLSKAGILVSIPSTPSKAGTDGYGYYPVTTSADLCRFAAPAFRCVRFTAIVRAIARFVCFPKEVKRERLRLCSDLKAPLGLIGCLDGIFVKDY